MGLCASCQACHKAAEHAADDDSTTAWKHRHLAQLIAQSEEEMHERPEQPILHLQPTFEHYDVLSELGRGEFGVVSLVVEKTTGDKFAIKSISKEWAEREAANEIEILHLVAGCPNIVRLHDTFEDADEQHLVMEVCQGGSWYDRLVSQGPFSEAKAAESIKALLQAVQHCHSLGVIHRDIKADNVLWRDNSDNPSQLRLADFGLSELAPRKPVAGTGGMPALERTSRAISSRARNDAPAVGSTWYMSPEVLHHRGAGKPCDVWSIGVLLYLTLTGQAPFDGPTEPQVFYAIKYEPVRFTGAACKGISVNAKDMISRMLTKDPRRRATIPELLTHPWLNGGQSSARVQSANTHQRTPTAAAATPPVVPDVVVTRLQRFAGMGDFEKLARRVLVSMLAEEKVSGLVKIFKSLDSDSDGRLTLPDIHAILASRGWYATEAQAKELLNHCDFDCDGYLNCQEFLAATIAPVHLQASALLAKAYSRLFNLEDSACAAVDTRRLDQALVAAGVTEVDAAALMREADVDGDGRLGLQDFCSYLAREKSTVPPPALGSPVVAYAGGLAVRAGRTASDHPSILSILSPTRRTGVVSPLVLNNPVFVRQKPGRLSSISRAHGPAGAEHHQVPPLSVPLTQLDSPLGSPGGKGRGGNRQASEPGARFETPGRAVVQFNLATVEDETVPSTSSLAPRPSYLGGDASRRMAKKSSLKKRVVVDVDEETGGVESVKRVERRPSVRIGGAVPGAMLSPFEVHGSPRVQFGAAEAGGREGHGGRLAAAAPSRARQVTLQGSPPDRSPLGTPPMSPADLPNSLATPRPSLGKALSGKYDEELELDASIGGSWGTGRGRSEEGAGSGAGGGLGAAVGRAVQSQGGAGAAGDKAGEAEGQRRLSREGSSRRSPSALQDSKQGSKQMSRQASGSDGRRMGQSDSGRGVSRGWGETPPDRPPPGSGDGRRGADTSTPGGGAGAAPSPRKGVVAARALGEAAGACAGAAAPLPGGSPDGAPAPDAPPARGRPLSRASSASSLNMSEARSVSRGHLSRASSCMSLVRRVSFNHPDAPSRSSSSSSLGRLSVHSRNSQGGASLRRTLSRASSCASLGQAERGQVDGEGGRGYQIASPMRGSRRGSELGGSRASSINGSRRAQRVPSQAWTEEESCLTLATKLGIGEQA